MSEPDHGRRFQGPAERLRSPERTALLEVDRVANLVLEGLTSPRLLDVGTGTGLFAEVFAARGAAVTGIDTNAGLLEVAQRLVTGVEFRQADAQAIPYADRTFDVAYLGHVLHEADDPVAALREARRVARQRVAILEWPYAEGGHGPPLNHRIEPGCIEEMARVVGLGAVESIALSHMVLYRMAAVG